VYRGTSDGYLVALDASTGRMLWARRIADGAAGETLTMAPLVYDDRVLIGPAGSENAIKGWVGAFRAEDGVPLWRFNIVPGKDDPGYETWKADAKIPLGGGAVWTPIALDTARGQMFVATTNPAPDFPSEARGDKNLYTNTLLVLDIRTGKVLWYDQLVPEDDHDWDLTQVSPLITVRIDGQPRDLVITGGEGRHAARCRPRRAPARIRDAGDDARERRGGRHTGRHARVSGCARRRRMERPGVQRADQSAVRAGGGLVRDLQVRRQRPLHSGRDLPGWLVPERSHEPGVVDGDRCLDG
jgi:alcohol dehydrogenase (cytochrome c)